VVGEEAMAVSAGFNRCPRQRHWHCSRSGRTWAGNAILIAMPLTVASKVTGSLAYGEITIQAALERIGHTSTTTWRWTNWRSRAAVPIGVGYVLC
jgi:hypothetical protein